jgi:hypothetical protein
MWLAPQSRYVFAEIATEYLPLTDGNFWTYSVVGDYGAYDTTVKVLQGATSINGVQTKALKTLGGPFNGGVEYWTNDAEGIRVHRAYLPDSEAGPGSVTFNPPMVLANTEMGIHEFVNSNGKAVFSFRYYGTFILDYESTNKVAGIETISVPAGTYQTIVLTSTNKICGKILGEPYVDRQVGTTWLAENIGVIKDKSTDSVGSEIYVLTRTSVRPPSRVLPFLPFLLDD